MEQIQAVVQDLVSKFNPSDVFSSLQSFIGSGYVFLVVAGLLVFGLVKKITKLLVIGIICFIVWYLFSTGFFDEILAPINELLYNVINGIH